MSTRPKHLSLSHSFWVFLRTE